MTLHTCLARLERAHATEPEGVTPDFSQVGAPALKAMGEAYGETLDCPDNDPDSYKAALLARIGASQEAMTCPQSISDADLFELLCDYSAKARKA